MSTDRTRLKIPKRYLFFLFGGLLTIIGLALALGSTLEAQETQLLQEEGVDTTADVVETTLIGQAGQDPSEVSTRIRFTTSAGEVVETTVTDCGSREPEPPGTTVQVTYAPSDPESVQFAELACRAVADATQFQIVGVIVLVLAAAAFVVAIRTPKGTILGAKHFPPEAEGKDA